MTALAGWQKRTLKAMAHAMKPTVTIGKGGVSSGLLQETDQALNDHELIKIRFNEFKEQKAELLEAIAAAVGGEPVGLIGHIAILYRPRPNPADRRILLPAGPDLAIAAPSRKRSPNRKRRTPHAQTRHRPGAHHS